MKITPRHLQMNFTPRYLQTVTTTRSLSNGITGVFYDWDGTLMEFRGNQFLNSINEVLFMFGHPKMQSLADSKSIRDTFTRTMQCQTKTEEALEAFRHHFSTHPLSRSNLIPGAEELIKRIKDYRLPQGVVSNLDHNLLVKEIEILGLSDYFSVVIGSKNDQHLKPSPDLLIEALNSIGIAPSRSILYLGDTPGDVTSAKAAGCTSILVGNPRPEVKPDITVTNLSEVGIILDNVINNKLRSL